MNDWQTCVGNFQPIKTRAVLTWFVWHFTKQRTMDYKPLADAVSQDEHHATFIGIGFQLSGYVGRFRHLWSTKVLKTNRRRSQRTKWILCQPFYFSTPFYLFSFLLLFHCSTSECHCTKSAILQTTLCFDLTLVWRLVKVRVCQLVDVCQHAFATLSLQCEGRLKSFPLYVSYHQTHCEIEPRTGWNIWNKTKI